MTIEEYFDIKADMCNTYNDCGDCPFNGDCSQTEIENLDRAITIIEQWDTANAPLTNEEMFESVFGFNPLEKIPACNGCPSCFESIGVIDAIADPCWWLEEFEG